MSARTGTIKQTRTAVGAAKTVSRIPVFANDVGNLETLIKTTDLGDPVTSAGLHTGKRFNIQGALPADSEFDWATETGRTN